MEHLLRRHGDRTRTVLDLIASDPKLAEPMHPDSPYLLAEGVIAVTREGAVGLDDVMVRRTRLALETRGGGVDVAESVARVLAPYANWSEDDIAAQVATVAERRDALQPVPGGRADQQEIVADDGDLAVDSVEAALLEEVEFATGLPGEGTSA